MSDTISSPVPASSRPYVAEAIGTMMLMIVGPGSAILAADAMGTLGVALAFGLVLLAMAYTIGHVSGCHINPAVTLGFWLAKKIDTTTAAFYVVSQVVGAVVGGLVLYVVTEGGDLDKTGVFAANGWGDTLGTPFGLGSVIIVEILFTALLVFVVLGTTTEGYPSGFGGIAAGLTLGMIHIATIPVDNTSVNPARSLGAAVFAGGDHFGQVWAFIVFPLIGGAVGWGAHVLLHGNRTA
jgi:aquaporin Z